MQEKEGAWLQGGKDAVACIVLETCSSEFGVLKRSWQSCIVGRDLKKESVWPSCWRRQVQGYRHQGKWIQPLKRTRSSLSRQGRWGGGGLRRPSQGVCPGPARGVYWSWPNQAPGNTSLYYLPKKFSWNGIPSESERGSAALFRSMPKFIRVIIINGHLNCMHILRSETNCSQGLLVLKNWIIQHNCCICQFDQDYSAV